MSGKKSLHSIVLAAGASRRFGSPKQLVRFDGQLLVQRVIAAATELTGPAVTVVLGAHAAEIAGNLPPGSASILINRGWQEGIASSIRLAVSRLPGACDGALIMLADQPLVAAAGLTRLAAAWRRQTRSIIASRYGVVTGVPAIFPRWSFNDLAALRGDQGARLLLSRYHDHVVRLAHPEAAIDIDYPEDLLELGG
ncbi:MAG TPA: nucleotidyltransferase family protein [Steroidobacteraceae bacterium]|jgi:molybdenum cofactor cytidylyltransferase|nr:nucleotidyltransferase family protein [Steroidobacteraceae bacterium]